MSKLYKIDRRKFIDWVWVKYLVPELEIKQDLKMGGEYIITASELLNRAKNIPTELLEDYDGKNVYIDGTNCQLIYKNAFG